VTLVERGQRRALPRQVAFWLTATVFFLLLAGSAAPAPLYGVYQAKWGFSATTLTEVFAVYAVSLLLALLVFGSVSDHLGRRRVISIALIVNAAACAVFLTADGVGMLFLARGLQGIAVGVATSALGATLIDLEPEGGSLASVLTSAFPLWGLAVGGLGGSLLVQYAPGPTHLIWWLLLGASLLGAIGVLGVPETAAGHPNVLASLRPSIGIPPHARGTFAETAPIMVAAWALNGFYLSLGPSLAGQVVGSRDLVWGGLVIFVLTSAGGIATVMFRSVTAGTAMMGGCVALLTGTATSFGAIQAASAPTLLVGTAIAGVGFGLSFFGSLRALSALASAPERASLVAAVFIEAYAAFSVPVVIAGVGVTRFGLHRTALVYSATLSALVALALINLVFQQRSAAGKPRTLAKAVRKR
jgi:MFS family permease